jgi:hypothetical protein
MAAISCRSSKLEPAAVAEDGVEATEEVELTEALESEPELIAAELFTAEVLIAVARWSVGR